MKLLNAFSLQMIKPGVTIYTKEVFLETVRFWGTRGNFVSCIGHSDTAKVLTTLLGCEIAYNRVDITLTPGDRVCVAQLQGGRLLEGATTLPAERHFTFVLIDIQEGEVEQ